MKRQDVNSKHSRHGSGTFNGKATPLLMSHKVMFVLLGECVCGCLAVCGIEHLLRVILCAYVCAFDGQRADTKRQRSNIPANPLWQVFLPGPAATVTDPPSIFPKWQAGSIKNLPVSRRVPEPGHRQTGRCQQRCHTGCNCTISHLIPFICWSSAASRADLANCFVCSGLFAILPLR